MSVPPCFRAGAGKNPLRCGETEGMDEHEEGPFAVSGPASAESPETLSPDEPGVEEKPAPPAPPKAPYPRRSLLERVGAWLRSRG